MTEREKINSLDRGGVGVEAFYKLAQSEAYDQVIMLVLNGDYDGDPYILARRIEAMKGQS